MKKILLSLLLMLPITVFAEVNYDITDYYIRAYILNNGDMKVEELFVLDGTFNGYERDVVYTNDSLVDSSNYYNNSIYNASGVYDVGIKGKYVDDVSFATMDDVDYDLFESVEYASNGSKAKYIKSDLPGGERYRMYYVSNNDRVAFLITYTVDNAVVVHNDVAELYWNFIGSDYADDLENLNIKVYLPEVDSSNIFRIWAHGDVTGEINYLEEDGLKVGAYATMDKVDAYDPVDIRITFDNKLIKDTSELDFSNTNALESILEVEEERAEEANKLRETLKIKYKAVVIGTIIYYVALLLSFIYVVKKYGLDNKSDFDYEYNREFIDDYNVEVVDYLMNKKNITPNAMSASIMNLIYKKNIKVEELPGDNKKKDYIFTLLNDDNTNKTEKYLIAFLFDNIGSIKNDVKTFTTLELKKYASSSKHCDSFINSYTAWKKLVISDGRNQIFYEDTGNALVFGLLFLLVSFLLVIAGYNFGVDFIFTYFTPIVGGMFLLYTILNTKKTSKGALHFAKWMAFKRFLSDFGSFNEKELPEIVLWERYLVYATVFGIADKVEKAMNVKIKEIELTNSMAYPNVYVYHNLNLSNSISKAINNSVQSSYQKQAANRAAAASSSSSGSGFGGGFSSGGGFGGGGGGGRGF